MGEIDLDVLELIVGGNGMDRWIDVQLRKLGTLLFITRLGGLITAPPFSYLQSQEALLRPQGAVWPVLLRG